MSGNCRRAKRAGSCLLDCPSVQSTTGVIVGADLAKNVFALCVADARWRPVESQRLTRAQFERWFANRAVSRVVMEACGSAHHWARWLGSLGIEVTLLPARYVRAYVRACAPGRWRCRTGATTTRPAARWPTSWRASPMRACEITQPTTKKNPTASEPGRRPSG